MKINDYGFKANISYKQAKFSGSRKRRKWTGSIVGTEQFTSDTKLRTFIKNIDLANIISIDVSMSFHGYNRSSTAYYNTFFYKNRFGIFIAKSDEKNKGEIAAEIEQSIENTITKPPLRGGLSDRFYDEFGFWSQGREYFAVPVSLKLNRSKFKKGGPKPDSSLFLLEE